MRAFAFMLALLAALQTLGPNPSQKQAQTTAQYRDQTAPKNGFIFWNTSRQTIEFLLHPVPQSDPLRLAQLRQTFIDFQCSGSSLREQAAAPTSKNLLCILHGTSPDPALDAQLAPESGTIVFLAHYEHEGMGQSAVDNWSGAIMLPLLYHALSATARHHTFLFAEVAGKPGGKTLFDSFTPAERHAIRAVVALDALGLAPAQFYIDPNDISGADFGWWFIRNQLLVAAADQRQPTPLAAIPGSWFKTDDTLVFRHHSIPSILIQSVNREARDLPGSARDTSSAVNRDTYYNTFVLLAYYSAELDKPWPISFVNAASRPSRGRH
jgi:Peptidase family M28